MKHQQICQSEIAGGLSYTPRNLHIYLANTAQGDIVVTMKPFPKLAGIPVHSRMNDGTQTRVSV